MKFSLFFVGTVFGEQCFEGLFNVARSIKQPSIFDVNEALANFGACCERYINLETDKFISTINGMRMRPHEGCVLSFVERIYECSPVANDHPFCREDHPSYNATSCAIKLNQCLLEALS